MLVSTVPLPRYIIHDERIEYYKNGVSNGVSIYRMTSDFLIMFEYRRNGRVELSFAFRRLNTQDVRAIGVTEYKNGKLHGLEFDISVLDLDDIDGDDVWIYKHNINGKVSKTPDMDLVHEYHWMVLEYLQNYDDIIQAQHESLFARQFNPIHFAQPIQPPQLPNFPALHQLMATLGFPIALPNP